MRLEIVGFIGNVPFAGRCTECDKWFPLAAIPTNPDLAKKEIQDAYSRHTCGEPATRVGHAAGMLQPMINSGCPPRYDGK